jgi:hypothetical protein
MAVYCKIYDFVLTRTLFDFFQMQQGLMKIGIRVSSERMQKLFSFLDGNSNGAVDYSEFMQLLSRASRIAERNPRAQTWAKERDSMQEVLVRDAIRSRFQDAQQVLAVGCHTKASI